MLGGCRRRMLGWRWRRRQSRRWRRRLSRRWRRRRRGCGCSWRHNGVEDLVDGMIRVDGGDVFSVKGASLFERREGWVGCSRGEGDLESLAEDVFRNVTPQVDVGLAGCEELLLGKVELSRLRPLLMFFFQKGSLTSHDRVEGLHVRFYHG